MSLERRLGDVDAKHRIPDGQVDVAGVAELVESLEAAGTGTEANPNEPQDLELKTVRLEISASRVIPEGLLVSLTFELSEEITLNHEIPLENLKQTAQSLDGQEIRARGLGGSISPIEPIPACFFYMH